MATLLERLSELAHFTRTPSLTDTDDSAPSEELPEPPPTIAAVVATPTGGLAAEKGLGASETMAQAAKTRSRASTVLLMLQRPFVVVLSQPQILGCLVRYLTWHEFHSVVMTSHAVRSALDVADCIDPVLARFVPGYRQGTRPGEQMRITLEDLESFMLSQSISLHLYPAHALGVVDSLLHVLHLAEATTERFQLLTAAHSRIVLLLRSRATQPLELDDAPCARASPQLVFPAPLFCQAQNTPPPLTKPSDRRSLFSRRKRPLPPVRSTANKRPALSIRSRSTPPHEPDVLDMKPPRPWVRRHSSLPGTPASCSRGSLSVVSERPLPSGPHDLLYATVPGRAPILRVFVPTDVLSQESIRACEALLLRAGLWDCMKPGDVVCNLGYVPRVSSPTSVDQFGRLASAPTDVRQTEWLIFTGSALVPYSPPAPPPPDVDVLSIPGPAYYSHIYTPAPCLLKLPALPSQPQHGPAVGGLVYALSIPKRATEPQLRLDSTVTLVPSARGIVRVWRPVWIASFRVEKPQRPPTRTFKGKERTRDNPGIADEWTGEWVLEGMGTREGEHLLRAAIDDGQLRFWEWVKERSGPGRICLRLVDSPVLGITEVPPPVPPLPASVVAERAAAEKPPPRTAAVPLK
ncbi:hypothetical protein CTheo_2593 [Ceratobasidium theobromae]|uniref:Uncharacterized protein n=1 Tax=Ceratobasidium theobromae TaxID=1582974 RepID=A0A5N5QQF5_9AGAM|nr:hypothetical protein CTheo_2593 [Ceratobasidium theobromae]